MEGAFSCSLGEKTVMKLPFKSLITTLVSQAHLGLETVQVYTVTGGSKLP